MTLEQRLKSKIKISESGCHEWLGSIDQCGYGRIAVNKKNRFAHRISFQIYKGPIAGRLQVCHKCDNPKCINPDHLFLGTAKDNAADMVVKHRAPQQKLTPIQVTIIREAFEQGHPPKVIAKYFNVTRSYVWNIHAGRNWAHLQPN